MTETAPPGEGPRTPQENGFAMQFQQPTEVVPDADAAQIADVRGQLADPDSSTDTE